MQLENHQTKQMDLGALQNGGNEQSFGKPVQINRYIHLCPENGSR